MRKVLYILGGLAVIIVIACLVKTQTKSKKISFNEVQVIKHAEDNDTQIRVIKNGKWGMLDKNGKILGDIEYNSISPFYEGISRVEKDGKFGYVDEKFNFIVKPKYDYGYYFTNGFAIVKNNNKAGFINKKGKEILTPNYYNYISNFDTDGHAIAKIYSENKEYLINTEGKVVKDLSAKK